MVKEWTDSWIDLMEDSFTIPEEEEPASTTQAERHYQSVYDGWIGSRPRLIKKD